MKEPTSSPVFYTKFAETYRDYASNRKAYIAAVNEFVMSEIGSANTLVDVGSGDGIRAARLAKKLGVSHITMVDNSDGMLDRMRTIKNVTVINADISCSELRIPGKYDVVLCLWNVLGHVPIERVCMAMKNLKSLLNESGVLILDVNNRYNVFHYGAMAVVRNLLKDLFFRKKSNGNFDLCIDTGFDTIHTTVHIFNPFEVENLIQSAGLTITRRAVIDYEDGSLCKSVWGGQLVYKLERQ